MNCEACNPVSYTHLDVYKRQPIYDELENAEEVLINEINSACDNPIVDPDTQNIYHGGNFHGDYSLKMHLIDCIR